MDNAVYILLVPMLTFLSVTAIGASVIISRQQRRLMTEARLKDSRWVEIPEEEKGSKFRFLQFMARVGSLVSHGSTQKSLNEQLMRAGYFSSAAPAVYIGVKILLLAVGLVTMTVFLVPLKLAVTTKLLLILLGATVLSFIPNMVVMVQLKKRYHEIRQYLPDAVDLLEICVSSGIGLDMAWNIVSDEILQVSPILAGAMSLTNFEVNLGASRTEAMRHMAERTGVDELSSLAAILIQTERFGTSIAEVLRVFAASMREERSFSAEESAEKMAVKLIFPMVLFMFPSVLIMLAGPAFITMTKALASGH
jgi:tight adherence protein C